VPDWDERARPYLEVFLTQQTPYAADLPQARHPREKEIQLALSQWGKPEITREDFQRLLDTLGCAGNGWLRPERAQRELEKMAANWQGPAPPVSITAAEAESTPAHAQQSAMPESWVVSTLARGQGLDTSASMVFCPQCNAVLPPADNTARLTCSHCGWSSKATEASATSNAAATAGHGPRDCARSWTRWLPTAPPPLDAQEGEPYRFCGLFK